MRSVVVEENPLRSRRAAALSAALIAAGHSGNCSVADPATNKVTLDQPFAPEHQAIADDWDWTEAGGLADRRAEAVTLAATGSDPVAIGTRSLAAFAATRDNDQAEAFAALLDLLRITPYELAARIEQRREKTPATPGAPDADGVVTSATTRLDGPAVLGTIAAYITAGAGDPLSPKS